MYDAYGTLFNVHSVIAVCERFWLFCPTARRTCSIRSSANSGRSSMLDAVLSVAEVKIFKPDPGVYQIAVDRLQLPKQAIGSNNSDRNGIPPTADCDRRLVS
ncbi:MAG TPA: hypothetical protein VIJ43_15480 [Burkholderiales bacterium]